MTIRIVAGLMLLLAVPGVVLAEETALAAAQESGSSYDDPASFLHERHVRRYAAGAKYFLNQYPFEYELAGLPDPVLGHGFLGPALKPVRSLSNQLEDEHGLHINASYTTWSQWASKRTGTSRQARPKQLTFGRFDFGGYWEFTASDLGKSRVLFLMRQGTMFGYSTGTTLDQTIGDVSGVNGGYCSPIALRKLAFEQDIGDWLSVQVGRVHMGSYFFVNPIADDETSQFTNSIFDGSPNPILATGTGAIVRFKELFGNKELYFSAGVQSMGDTETTGMSHFGDGMWGTILEFGWTPSFDGLQGHYRFNYWYSDNRRYGSGSGSGIGLNFDQEIAKNWILFLTYAYNGHNSAPMEHQLAIGSGILEPFGRRGEMFGIAGGWARASENGRDEGVMETFYRFQVTDSIQISPNLQMIVNPALGDRNEVVFVGGVRVKVQF